ncbi:hypothetical protein CARUB_v10011151mg, partial [Capsella rubella]
GSGWGEDTEQGSDKTGDLLEIWVTTKVEPNAVSWSKFLEVDMRPVPTGFLPFLAVRFEKEYGSFFINEEERVAVVFDPDHTAFIIGDDGYFKTVSLGEAPK